MPEALEEKTEQRYEIGFLLANEEAAVPLAAFLKRGGAQITNEGSLRRIHLAYPIKKEESGVFGFFHFTAEPGRVPEMEQALRTDASILRSMIIKLPKISKKNSGTGAPRFSRPSSTGTAPVRPGAESSSAPSSSSSSSAKSSPVALSNEALEKKIEEILQ